MKRFAYIVCLLLCMSRLFATETIIIGGLLKKDDIMSLTKIPILGDLPILGPLLFQYKNQLKRKLHLMVQKK